MDDISPLPVDYLQPLYITYTMISGYLAKNGIVVTEDIDPSARGVYKGQILDWMAKGESYIIKTVLSNYVNVPLQSVNYSGDPTGSDFETLYGDSRYRDTYIQIRDLFISSALWQIYKRYYASGGTSNGVQLVRSQANIITAYVNSLQRLDQAGNVNVKNAFIGLKPAINSSKRMPYGASATDIESGDDQVWSAFTSMTNYRRGGLPI